MRAFRFPITLATLALALAACAEEEPTWPQPVEQQPAETYVVQTIDDAALPAVVHVSPPVEGDPRTYSTYVLYDTLRLITNGRYEHRARTETRDEHGTYMGRSYRNDYGTWRADGDGLHFASDYYEAVSFDAVRSGDGTTMVANQNIVWDDAATPKRFRYARR